ncbi:amidase [Penicillium riverlandense]|uniref:amidase n=1 Tax=Penicillium riverlandense TaxID=1903569 RepID=UPI0025483AD7|nr:amidase [Penicillium riverlandense]KAJ5811409.1 amidase [Penicillium riverlandense]
MQLINILPQLSIVELEGVSYYVRNRVEYLLPGARAELSGSLVPATVIRVPSDGISLDAIQDSFKRFLTEDDVFQDGFTRHGYLIIKPATPETPTQTLPKDVEEYLAQRLLNLVYLKGSDNLPQGPYFAMNGRLHQSWRLYPDNLGAFTTAVIPDDDSTQEQGCPTTFKPFHTAAFTGSNSVVPVPSRLYSQKNAAQPLAGMRIAIKDNMHLNGVTTTLGSRSYAELYGKQPKSSQYVDILIQKGAIIVGKTKMSAFAGSEVPPTECIDYFPPWNPRGDGYQGPSGSSSGAAATIAGYPWVDISLCTDTTGSMRHPASCHGVWGHRATWNSLPMKNIVPSTPYVYSVKFVVPSEHPTEIIYPTDWYPCNDENMQRMTEEFLAALENYLGVKHTKISLIELWTQTAPAGLHDRALVDFLRGIAGKVNVFDGYHSFDDFRREYSEKFGKEPYLSPTQKERWEDGAAVSNEDREESIAKIDIFKAWVMDHVLEVNDGNTMRVMLVPQGRPGANYRDGTPGTKVDKQPYSPIFAISMIGGPQIVIPIGQNKYDSVISGQKEYAPIMTTLVGPKDSDLTLLSIAEETLKMASWQSTLLTGRHMLRVGENSRNAQAADASKL